MQNNVPPAEVEPSTFPQKNIPSPDWLEELALTLAQNIRLVPHLGNTTPLPARLRILGMFFQAAYRYFEKSNQTETTVLHTAEWLLDNFYIIEQALRQIAENLPASFYKRLPKAEINNVEMVRIPTIAFALTDASDGRLDARQLKSFILLFQSNITLRIGGSWAFTPMLRLCILENMAFRLDSATWVRVRIYPLPARTKNFYGILKSHRLSKKVSFLKKNPHRQDICALHRSLFC